MEKKIFDVGGIDPAWCPGCGNFGILEALRGALAELEIRPENIVIVSGIGQAAKIAQYVKANFFNGLHGRALPVATAIKAANPSLTVIAESGDGDMYGEGGNHFIHAIRRNPGIVNIVHNNMVYGLTKGQASPTSVKGFKTALQVEGVFSEPFNPLAVAVALGASFAARASITDIEKTKEIIKEAIMHKSGYSLVDILQPCVTFNKLNTYEWFKNHTDYLEDSFDPSDRVEAFKRTVQPDKYWLGVLYKNSHMLPFESALSVYSESQEPLFKRSPDLGAIKKFILSKT